MNELVKIDDAQYDVLVTDITTLIDKFIKGSDETIDLKETSVQLEVLSKVVGSFIHQLQTDHGGYYGPTFIKEVLKFVVDVAINSYNSIPCECSTCVAERDSPNLSTSTRGHRMQ